MHFENWTNSQRNENCESQKSRHFFFFQDLDMKSSNVSRGEGVRSRKGSGAGKRAGQFPPASFFSFAFVRLDDISLVMTFTSLSGRN